MSRHLPSMHHRDVHNGRRLFDSLIKNMVEVVKSSELFSTTKLSPDTDRTGAFDTMVGATGPMKEISRRRSRRHYWRIVECIVMLVLDATLIDVAFSIAYYLRYYILGKNGSYILSILERNLTGSTAKEFYFLPFSKFASLQSGIVIGLIAIFAMRGLYKIHPTGTWFRQAWTITKSATLGLTLLIAYYFVFPSVSNSRLIVPFVWATVIVILSLGRLVLSGV